MMSYLWILLLGSLLASSAKAQDDGAPAEEAATDSETQAPKLDPTPEANGEPDTDKETNHTAAEIPPVLSEPEPTVKPEAGANATVTPADDNETQTTPAGDDAELVHPADSDEATTTPASDDAELVAPVDDNKAPTTPASDDAELVNPADSDEAPTTPTGDDAELVNPADSDEAPTTPTGDDAELVAPVDDNEASTTPASDDSEERVIPAGDDAEPASPAEGVVELFTLAAGKETEATATTQVVPVVDPEVGNPEAEQTTANVKEEDPTASADVTHVKEESGPDDKVKPEINPAVEENKEEPTDPTTEQIEPVINLKPNAAEPSDEENELDLNKDGGFNLEDALSESNPHQSRKDPNLEPDAHVAGAKGNDGPEARASSGSLAGIISAIGVAAVGAVTGYFTYQKKKLCFKNRQEADPEAARKADAAEAQSDPQVLSNLLNSS